MSPEEAVAKLHGNEYGKEGSKELFDAMKAAGLVAVFGASDDLMEFRGAIYDEVGACNGATAYLDTKGLLQNDCENEECPHFSKMKEKAATVTAAWAPPDGLSWRIDTDIQHRKFTIIEDGEPFCEGVVFALADVAAVLPS